MLNAATKSATDDLLNAVRSAPAQLPIEQLVAVHKCGVDVDVTFERDGLPATVFATRRRDRRLTALTARELEVASLAAAGLSNAQIATALFISVATVKDHVHSIFRRTGLVSRSQLIAAWYGGLTDPSTSEDCPK